MKHYCDARRRFQSPRIGELLLAKGLLSQEQLQSVLKLQLESLTSQRVFCGQIMLEQGYISDEDIRDAFMCQYDIPYLPLTNYLVDPEVSRIIPKDVAMKFQLVAVDRFGPLLSVACANPLDLEAIDYLEKETGYNIQIFVASWSEILQEIRCSYGQN